MPDKKLTDPIKGFVEKIQHPTSGVNADITMSHVKPACNKIAWFRGYGVYHTRPIFQGAEFS